MNNLCFFFCINEINISDIFLNPDEKISFPISKNWRKKLQSWDCLSTSVSDLERKKEKYNLPDINLCLLSKIL